MKQTKLEIPGLNAEALFIRPDDIAEFPGVLFLTDIWGPRPGNIGMAERLAEKGFAVLLPNVVHRYGPIQPDGLETDDPIQIWFAGQGTHVSRHASRLIVRVGIGSQSALEPAAKS